MIQNLPTPDSLDRVALRLYFGAWSSLLEILLDFQRQFDGFDVAKPPQAENLWFDEWQEYLSACQSDLQSACSIMQQSNELALKSKLCAVSPFLLLLKTDPKLNSAQKDVDFSDLRTLDAVDLPAAVNTFCATPLSDRFVQLYGDFRRLRNQVIHLGSTNETFTPHALMQMMIEQYLELWPGTLWLSEWVTVEAGSRYSVFHDFRHYSPHSEVLEQWPYAVDLIGKSSFKKLTGFSKSQRRYHCPECARNAKTKSSDPWQESELATSYLLPTGEGVKCLLCGTDWPILRVRCGECGGNVLCNSPGDFHGVCLTCGEVS